MNVTTPVPTHRAVVALRHEDPALRVRDGELEPRPPVAPVVGEDGQGGGFDVGRRHRPEARCQACPGYHRAMATLSRADVEHVAHLARLGLTDDELTRLEGQLNHILDQYAILAKVPTDHIPPTAQTIELENILRDDVAGASLAVEAVLAHRSGARRRVHRRARRSSASATDAGRRRTTT